MCGSLDRKLIHGEIVLCDRGDIGCVESVDKGITVKKLVGWRDSALSHCLEDSRQTEFNIISGTLMAC